MNKLKTIFILSILFLSVNILFAQKQKDLRINELFLNNVDNLADEYGRHVPWVEIFNSSYNNVNISECYLTNDTTGLAAGVPTSRWYRIPKGDPKTVIPQRSFLIFYLDNMPTYGVFHTNFNPMDSNSTNYVALISSNGRTLIDFFPYKSSLRTATHSYGYQFDFGNKNLDGEIENELSELKYFTPGSQNYPEPMATKSEEISKKDKYGLGLTVISMVVVFAALFLIFVILKLFARMSNKPNPRLKLHSAQKKAKKEEVKNEEKQVSPLVDNGEELAAISMALHYHLNAAHDQESEVITIETPSAHYSPWSQKHFTVKGSPKRR
ncbi:MAG: putative exported protein [Bacteroidetes bacterium]|nr:putative exported protein [Bacteroidota bacterium]